MKILVVEDDADVLDVVTFIIENAGYEVITARNGQEGLERALKDRPNLIVTDVLMPVMGGYEFYKKLKETPITAIIPVLILTARGAMEDTFKIVGADAFLAKPFEDYILLSKIAELLSRPNVLHPPPLPAGIYKHKILIADNDEDAVETMATRLRDMGHQIKTALSGADVIPKVLSFEPEILVMNIQMSGRRTASEIIEAIKEMPEFRDTVVLVYSYYHISKLGSQSLHEQALNIDALHLACLKAGARKYLGAYKNTSFWKALKKFL